MTMNSTNLWFIIQQKKLSYDLLKLGYQIENIIECIRYLLLNKAHNRSWVHDNWLLQMIE